jgi:uncharacterized protein YcfJ
MPRTACLAQKIHFRLHITEFRRSGRMGTRLAPELASNCKFEEGDLMNTSLVVQRMKRYLAVVLVLLTLAFVVEPISSVASAHSAASAQTRRYRRVRRKRSFWQKHRDKLTVAGTALGGAAVGGLAGGKKGAAIGALVGGGGGAVYTYKIRKRNRRRY